MIVRLAGWVSRQQFAAECYIDDLGYGPRAIAKKLTPINKTYNINDSDAEALARERNRNKRRLGVADQKHDAATSSFDVDVRGAAGELAVAQWLQVKVNRAIYSGSDGGIDLIARSGRTVDVKTTRHQYGRLFFDDLSKFTADIAVLVVISSPSICSTWIRTHTRVTR